MSAGLLRNGELPTFAVFTFEPLIGRGMIELHRFRVPCQLLIGITHADVTEQHRFRESAAILEAITGLLSREATIDPAVIVVLSISSGNFGLRTIGHVYAEFSHMRQHQCPLFTNKQ